MAKQQFKGGTLLGPVPPTLVTVGSKERGDENVLTVAWTGILNTVPPKAYISVRPKRHSYQILKEHGEFVIHPVPASLVRTADSCGVYTGAKFDKFERFRLTKEGASAVSCPVIAECPIAIECRVTDVIPLGSHDMFLADIVAVDVEEAFIEADGRFAFERADLIAYLHGSYYTLGKKLGTFGYSVKKKKKR